MGMKWFGLGMYLFIVSQILITQLIQSPIKILIGLVTGMSIGLYCTCGYCADRNK